MSPHPLAASVFKFLVMSVSIMLFEPCLEFPLPKGGSSSSSLFGLCVLVSLLCSLLVLLGFCVSGSFAGVVRCCFPLTVVSHDLWGLGAPPIKHHASSRHAFVISSTLGGIWFSTRYHAWASILFLRATHLPSLVAGSLRSRHTLALSIIFLVVFFIHSAATLSFAPK